jgi:NADPH-dependent ferric siderophore reductase
VLRVTDLTPRMRRITLGGAELAGFTSVGSDDHIKLLFAARPRSNRPSTRATWAATAARGRPCANTRHGASTW